MYILVFSLRQMEKYGIEQMCGDFSIICNDCYDDNNDKYSSTIWNQDGIYSDDNAKQPKRYDENNTFAIAKTTSNLKDVFELKKIKKIDKFIKKRDNKYNKKSNDQS